MTVLNNKKAFHNYIISDKYESGLALTGWQTKSIKAGTASIKESFCFVNNNEIYCRGMQITIWKGLDAANVNEPKDIKLLLNKNEIKKIKASLNTKGFTLVPLRMFMVRGLLKLEIGLGKGKKDYDKREAQKSKDEIKTIKQDLLLYNK